MSWHLKFQRTFFEDSRLLLHFQLLISLLVYSLKLYTLFFTLIFQNFVMVDYWFSVRIYFNCLLSHAIFVRNPM